MTTALILPAFGRGDRMGEDKLWADVGGQPMIAITLGRIAAAGCFDALVVAAPRARWEAIRTLASVVGLPEPQLVEGGTRRQDSVAAALGCCDGHDWICVHDAARPLASPELFRAVLAAAQAEAAATAGVPCVDTMKQVDRGHVVATLERSSLIATQTPQAFAVEVLRRAHAEALAQGFSGDDDCALVERLGVPVAVVAGEPGNRKITVPEDLIMLRAQLAAGR